MSLLQMSTSAGILIVVITILRTMFIYKLPKKTFMILWIPVIFRLLVPVEIPSVLSVYSWIPDQSVESSIYREESSVHEFFVNENKVIEQQTDEENLQTREEHGWSHPTISIRKVVWWVGFLMCSGFFLLAYRRGINKFKHSLPLETKFIQEWKRRHPLRRTLSIQCSDRVSAPLSYGIVQPVILLPQHLDMKDTKLLEYILTHEYIHIRRFDILYKAVLILSVCIHWFNPAVWMMFLLLNRDIELACDETVIYLLGEQRKSSYARALIEMEIQKAGIMPLCNNFSKNAVEERICAIMKSKKSSIFTLVLATVLIIGVTVAFATSDVTHKQKYEDMNLSMEEVEKLLALKFDGYEEMSITQYQNKVWTIMDTPEYQKLWERISTDGALYEQKDSDDIASFLFNTLEPLTAEKWKEREFGGYVQTNYEEASDNAVMEYSFTLAIKNPQTLTVGEYDKIRLSINRELHELIQNKTLEQLQDEDFMNDHIRAAVESIEMRYSNDKLQIDLNYMYQPLSGLKEGNTEEIQTKEQERREYPNATREDYRSLLALKTPDYQTMSVSEFNRNLIEWANEDYGRSERVAMDDIRKEYQIPLSEEEKTFIELTVRASGIENAELVRSHHTSEPVRNPILNIDLPIKEEHSGNEVSMWCNASYQLSYHIENQDRLSIGERDRYLSEVLSEIQRFWSETKTQEMVKMNKQMIEKKFGEIAMRTSNQKIKFSIVRGQVYFEHGVEQNYEEHAAEDESRIFESSEFELTEGRHNSNSQYKTNYILSEKNGEEVVFIVKNNGLVDIVITINEKNPLIVSPGKENYVTASVKDGFWGAKTYSFKAVTGHGGGKVDMDYSIIQKKWKTL